MSSSYGITADEVRDGTLTNLQISAIAAIVESKISFNISSGHNHNGVNSRASFGAGSSAVVVDSTFTGAVNGSNTTFTMAANFMASTTAATVNGIRQKRGVHFTESVPNQIVFDVAPVTGSTLIFDYISA